MKLREINYLAQSYTASTWQKHHVEPICVVLIVVCVPNTFTLLPLLLLKIGYAAMAF